MRPRLLQVIICLGLLLLTLIAYGDMVWGSEYEFVSFDDYHYVRDNVHVHTGLTWQSLWWALTSLDAFNWHPVTWLSLQLDWQIHGNHPRGFHITNLLLHATNVVLLFLVLRRLTGVVWPATAVAAFFAVHPLHVESVAWVTERKDVLSTFFWILTMMAYARYAERPGTARYLLVLVCLTLGLMSKAMLVTLPCVLLLLDFWPLRRWPTEPVICDDSPTTPSVAPRIPQASLQKLLLEKIPFFVLVAGCSMLTIRAQGMLLRDAQEALPLHVRLLNALVSYAAYLRQMLWPSDLAILYLHPMEQVSLVQGLMAGLFLASATLLALCWWRRRPYLLVGWLWYLGTLIPVIGLLQVGQQARADRYTYVPLIGIFLALCWGAADMAGGRRARTAALFAAGTALLVVCTALTRAQLPHWRNSMSLWDQALQVSGDDPQMHSIAVRTCLENGELDTAIVRATVFRSLCPRDWRSHRLLASALSCNGKLDEALESLRRGLALQPDSAEMHNEMATILWMQGKIPAALAHYAAIARIQPESVEGQHYLGIILQEQGKYDDAVRCLEEAVRLAPQGVLHHVDLALALEDMGDMRGAIGEYRVAISINSVWPEYYDQLARILATHPDASRRHGKEAVRRARAACSVTRHQYPPFLATLAAAYAEAGLFKEAITTAQRARELNVAAGDKNLADRLDVAVELYKKGLPFRDSELK